MSIDSVGNFLTVIRNGIMASKPSAVAPYSKMKEQIAQILLEEGFVRDVQVSGEGVDKQITVVFKYVHGESAIHEIKQVSRPGRREYSAIKAIKPVIGGLGVTILSTSHGILTHKKARQLSVGGEVICTVW